MVERAYDRLPNTLSDMRTTCLSERINPSVATLLHKMIACSTKYVYGSSSLEIRLTT